MSEEAGVLKALRVAFNVMNELSSDPLYDNAKTLVKNAIAALPDVEPGKVNIWPLDWQPCPRNFGCWKAESILGLFYVGNDDGWHASIDMVWEWKPEEDPRSYDGPWAAQQACQKYYEAKIRSCIFTHPASEGCPKGWKLVPEEPTAEMLDAGALRNLDSDMENEIYAAMLAAAPSIPEGE